MKKIPTLYQRNPEDMRYVTREINPAAAWALDGEGVATRKYDGTCLLLDAHGRWWARREVKPGKVPPQTYVPVETDPNTGKTVGWEPIDQSPFVKTFRSVKVVPTEAGTYELCGPKVNGNPEGFTEHILIPHADAMEIDDAPTDYDALAKLMQDFPHEGIVWHHQDGRMAKIKRRDFPR